MGSDGVAVAGTAVDIVDEFSLPQDVVYVIQNKSRFDLSIYEGATAPDIGTAAVQRDRQILAPFRPAEVEYDGSKNIYVWYEIGDGVVSSVRAT